MSFSAQNCNSLNISTHCSKQMKKIASILTLQTTIIFLSDLWLNTNTIGNPDNFFCPSYDFHYNSTTSKRGVGILISKKLNYTILHRHEGLNNNILGLTLQVENETVLLVSVYGPNSNDVNFFSDLRRILGSDNYTRVICAGDWNLTYCTDNTPQNIDIINMQSPPSQFRSNLLAGICDKYNLMDPFRLLHFDKRDFSFIPRH
jgi:exonuclease III